MGSLRSTIARLWSSSRLRTDACSAAGSEPRARLRVPQAVPRDLYEKMLFRQSKIHSLSAKGRRQRRGGGAGAQTYDLLPDAGSTAATIDLSLSLSLYLSAFDCLGRGVIVCNNGGGALGGRSPFSKGSVGVWRQFSLLLPS